MKKRKETHWTVMSKLVGQRTRCQCVPLSFRTPGTPQFSTQAECRRRLPEVCPQLRTLANFSDALAATVIVGSTETLSSGSQATVSNAGTSSAAILNFGIPAGPAGATGPAGSNGANGSTWHSGSGVPLSGMGNDGDFYLRTSTGDVYTKSAGSWGSPIENLTGPAGATGSSGSNGTNGATWYSGSAVPSNGTGNDGDFYLRTSTGDVYNKSAGSWGSPIENLTGPTGSTGPAGPNNVTATTTTNLTGLLYGDGANVSAQGAGKVQAAVSGSSGQLKLYDAGTASYQTITAGSSQLAFSEALNVTGSVTATSFSGDGANITNLDPAHLSSALTSAEIGTNQVANTNIRQSAGLSVIGNSTNSTANVADITAGSDNQILRRSGTALGFGAIDLTSSSAVSGALGIANGGTGQTSANNALNALLPTQTGNTGKFLKTDGSNTSWAATPGNTNTVGGYASLPGSSSTTGDIYVANDLKQSYIWNGSSWDLLRPAYVSNAHAMTTSGWTALNQSTETWTLINGTLHATGIPSSAGHNNRGYFKSLPASSNYTLNLVVCPPPSAIADILIGFGLRDSGTSKLKLFAVYGNNGTATTVLNETNSTTFSSVAFTSHWISAFDTIWLQIVDDGTNWKYKLSNDGLHYFTVGSEARNSFLTADQMWIGFNYVQTTYTDLYASFLGFWTA